MTTPAVLLFVVTCLAGIAAIREGGEDHSLVRGAVDKAEDGVDHVGGEDGDILSLGHHHGHHHGGGEDSTEADDSFDFYVYSMSYQPEFCRENDERFVGCHDPEEAWKGQLTIHGLWPNRNSGTWPSTCSDEKFDISILQDLSDDLSLNWPNVKSSPDSPGHESFWSHEWSKHGTCSGLSQWDYFRTALDLLPPTPDVVKESYGAAVRREDLEREYLGGGMSVFACKHGYLSEVRLCYEKMVDGAPGERVSCPDPTLKEDSCGDEIMIASFESRTTKAIE